MTYALVINSEETSLCEALVFGPFNTVEEAKKKAEDWCREIAQGEPFESIEWKHNYACDAYISQSFFVTKINA